MTTSRVIECLKVWIRCSGFRGVWSRSQLNAGEIRDHAESLTFLAEFVEPDAGQDASLRDSSDLRIRATFSASLADYVTTGEVDLWALSDKYSTMTPAAFWVRHG